MAECQDNSLLIEYHRPIVLSIPSAMFDLDIGFVTARWIRQGPFANMTSRDIMKFKTRNQEALHMLHQLKYCQVISNDLPELCQLPCADVADGASRIRGTPCER